MDFQGVFLVYFMTENYIYTNNFRELLFAIIMKYAAGVNAEAALP